MNSEPNGKSEEQLTGAVIDRFNDAFNRHDADGLALLLTDDTVFEDTSPQPDGRRVEGKAAVVEFWRGWFARNQDAHFDAEEIFGTGNRVVVRLGISQGAEWSAVAPARCRYLHRTRSTSGGKTCICQRLTCEKHVASSLNKDSSGKESSER